MHNNMQMKWFVEQFDRQANESRRTGLGRSRHWIQARALRCTASVACVWLAWTVWL